MASREIIRNGRRIEMQPAITADTGVGRYGRGTERPRRYRSGSERLRRHGGRKLRVESSMWTFSSLAIIMVQSDAALAVAGSDITRDDQGGTQFVEPAAEIQDRCSFRYPHPVSNAEYRQEGSMEYHVFLRGRRGR